MAYAGDMNLHRSKACRGLVAAAATVLATFAFSACSSDPTPAPAPGTPSSAFTSTPAALTPSPGPASPTGTATAEAPSPTPPPATRTPQATDTPEPTVTASETTAPGAELAVSLATVSGGFEQPVFVAQPPGDTNRLFVVEQPGRIRIIEDGQRVEQPFLDISDIVETAGSEQGLLGLAFHPDFASNGRFFVYYTAREGDGTNTLAEYHVSLDAGAADPGSARILFAVEDFAPNHNGGMLAFGPDGYLYVSLGDGGGGGDPQGNGQRLDTLLGKILRIDVDAGDPYAIPGDNPFGSDGERREIWAYGLRNPWRYSFDRASGDLWIGDVGQATTEEIDLLPAGTSGVDLGWNTYEGSGCFENDRGCGRSGFTFPVYEYPTATGCAVTGGYVYRGTDYPDLDGTYVFTDYCSGIIQGLRRSGDGTFEHLELLDSGLNISSFGEDNAGNVYVVDHQNGVILRVVAP